MGNEHTNILMLTNKDFESDPRVTKEAESLGDAGHYVHVLDHKRSSCSSKVKWLSNTLRFWCWCLVRSRSRNFDVVHAHDLDTLPIGCLISKLRNVPLVYDAHESYVDMIRDRIPESLEAFLRFAEHRLVRRCAKTIIAVEGLSHLVSEHPKDCTVVMNCPKEIPLPTHKSNHPLRLGYIGSLEPGRGIIEGIEAVNRTESWGMVIAGSGSLESEVLKHENHKVKYLGKVSQKTALQITALCDLHLATVSSQNANLSLGYPTRMFEAMMCGKPMVVSYFTEASKVVEKNDCGFVSSPESLPVSYLLEYLAKYPEELTRTGENGRKAWENQYNWAEQEKTLLSVYDSLGRD
jgi:glycosyltransferase involved in cell wall biosynthesis